MTPPLDGQSYAQLDPAPEPLDRALLGYLHGERVDGSYLLVGVFRHGEDLRLTTTTWGSHTCLPSVEDIEGVKREALQVYGIWRWVFQPA